MALVAKSAISLTLGSSTSIGENPPTIFLGRPGTRPGIWRLVSETETALSIRVNVKITNRKRVAFEVGE
jgi:hypothetical protein